MIKDSNVYTILIIEDNLGDYLLAKNYLEEVFLTPEIYRCESFRKAQHFKKNTAANLDVILLDLSLPDKGKEELMKEMLLLFCSTPIIVLTGYADFSFATKSITLGASDYLVKDDLNGTILHKSIVYSIERNKHILKHAAAEKEYADLFHLSPQPMWVRDLENDSFRAVNQATVQHYGYTAEEFEKMRHDDLLVPDSETSVPACSTTNGPNPNRIERHKKKDGSILQVEVTSNLILYKGQPAEVVLVNDITENLKQLEAIHTRNKELNEIQWMQSHVVRAPVARIMGLVNLISENIQTTPEEVKETLHYITQSAHELDGIIKEITLKTSQFKK